MGNEDRFVSVRSITLVNKAPEAKEIPLGETMNRLAPESRLRGTFKLKPFEDEAIPKITLDLESAFISTPIISDPERFASKRVNR